MKLNFADFWMYLLAKMGLLNSYIHTYKTLSVKAFNSLTLMI